MKKFLLKQKVFFLLTFISIISLVVTSLAVYFYLNNTLINNKKKEVFTNAIEQSHETLLVFENNKLATHMLSTRTRVKEYLLDRTDAKREELLNIFLEYTNENIDYLSIYLLDTNGIGLISTDPRFVGQDYSFRDYFRNSMISGSGIDVALGKTSNELGYYFAESVKGEDGSILGVMVIKVSQNNIDKSVVNSVLAQDSVIMIVDKFGVIVSTNQEDRRIKSLGSLNNQDLLELKENQKYLENEITSLQYDSVYSSILEYSNPNVIDLYDKEDNDQELISIVKIGDFPFYLIVETRLSVLNQQIFQTVLIVISIILIVLIIISLFIFYFLKQFLRPIDKFIAYFNSISNGNFSQELKIETRDEFSVLADRINNMAKDLKDLYNNLDEKVKEQTSKVDMKVKESEDQNKAILNILEDVETEKSKVENLANDLEKFKLAVENASDQIVITDGEGIVVYGNRAVEKITGYKPEEALGKKAGTLWKNPMPLEYYQNLWDVIKNKKKTFVGEIQNKRKSGEVYTAIVSISPVFNDEADIIYFVAIERDITKEKEVDKAKTEFVSLASHQLRTPLSAINWYTEMLLAGDAGSINEEQKRYLEEVAIGNKRMVNLVDDLLNVSRLDMGTFIIEPKPVNVYKLCKSSLDENRVSVINKKLVINEDELKDLGEFQLDEKLLRIVFQNLISNAIKYTVNSGTVKIYLSKLDKGQNFGGQILDEDSLAFFVEDSGMGIPIYQQDKIYTKLFRADNAKSSEVEGTGLGLYVVKSIIDKSGGSIWFKSEEDKGTTFFVTFPVIGMKNKDKIDNIIE